MKYIKLFLFIVLILFPGGCKVFGTVDWHEDFRFKGTVISVNVEEKMLLMKEFDATDGWHNRNKYEIPVNNIAQYNKGDKYLVIVETNITEDIWHLDHLRFELKPILE